MTENKRHRRFDETLYIYPNITPYLDGLCDLEEIQNTFHWGGTPFSCVEDFEDSGTNSLDHLLDRNSYYDIIVQDRCEIIFHRHEGDERTRI